MKRLLLVCGAAGVTALIAVPFAVATKPPTFTPGVYISGSNVTKAGKSRFCMKVTTKPAQHSKIVVTFTNAFGKKSVTHAQLNAKGAWVGSFVTGTKNEPGSGNAMYEVQIPGQQYPAEGSVVIGKAFHNAGAPACGAPQ